MNLLFFKAPWCTASNAIEHTVPGYAAHIDCDEDQETAAKYDVTNLPLFIAIDDANKEIARIHTTNMKVLDRWFKSIKEKHDGK